MTTREGDTGQGRKYQERNHSKQTDHAGMPNSNTVEPETAERNKKNEETTRKREEEQHAEAEPKRRLTAEVKKTGEPSEGKRQQRAAGQCSGTELLEADKEAETKMASVPEKQKCTWTNTEADMPGPRGLHPTMKKQSKTETLKPMETTKEAKAKAHPRLKPSTDADEGTTKTEAGWPHIGNDIHTVIVWRDVIILQRSNSLDDAYMFRWRQRDNYMALKTIAILSKKGYWICQKIKVYDTSPLRTSVTEENKRDRSSVIHRHLTQLLRAFGATEEVKLPECPLFWQQIGVDHLREFTTAMDSTSCLRGIPSTEWMPNQAWVVGDQLPLVMRRTDISRFRAFQNARWRSSDPPYNSTFAAYAIGENIPQRGQGLLWRFPSTTPIVEQTTLQLFTRSLETIHEQLTEKGLPRHFKKVEITLRGTQPGTRQIATAVKRIHQALRSYFFVKEVTLTVQIVDVDEDMWIEEDGEQAAAYILAVLKAAERTQIETIEDQLEGRETPYRTKIAFMLHLYSQITNEEVIVNTSAAIKRTLDAYTNRSGHRNAISETAHRRWMQKIRLNPIDITERSTLEADIDIGQIRWREASSTDEEQIPRTHIADNRRREAIMAIEDHLIKDLQEDA